MNQKYRQLVILYHVVLAGFFLPAALVFSITGGLYTFGFKGTSENKEAVIALELPSEPKLNELVLASQNYLTSQGLSQFPSGNPGLRKAGTSWHFDWSGLDYDFSLEPTKDAQAFKTVIKKNSAHRFLVQLHKAKGGQPFKVLAGFLAVAFVLLFLSGVLMAFAVPKLKKSLYLSLALGLVAFVSLAWVS